MPPRFPALARPARPDDRPIPFVLTCLRAGTSLARRAAFLFGLCAALLAAGPISAQAQSPVSTVKDDQGNNLMRIFDNGNLRLFQTGKLTLPGMVESTGGGFLLPDGTVLSSASDVQISLPFSGSASNSNPAFEVGNSGSGPAIRASSGDIVAASGDIVLSDGTALSGSGDLSSFSLPFSGTVSSSSPAFEVENTGSDDGVFVADAGNNGLWVDGAGDDGVQVTNSGWGFFARGVANDGALLVDAGDHGVDVDGPSNDGINVRSAGSDGIDVSGSAEMAGRFVGSHDDGPIVGVENNGTNDGVVVTGAGDDGFKAENVSYGLYVPGADVAGLLVSGDEDGIVAEGDADGDGSGLAGDFIGDVDVSQTLSAATKNFKIDHPQDPTGKYLKHTTIESPDMLNVYSGTVTLDASGEATVRLPDYFESINKDYRYQLTAIGAPGPKLHIAQEISNNQFRIAGGKSGMKVSWEVKGVRDDPYARQNRVQVEVQKPADKQGTYVHPEAYGAPKSQSEAARERREKKTERQEVESIKQEQTSEEKKDNTGEQGQ
jgi:hypothetical protein